MKLQDTLKSLSPLLLVAGASYLLVKKPIEVDWDEKDESHIGDEAEWDAESYEIIIADGDKVGYHIIKALDKDRIYWEDIEGRFRIPKGEEVGYHIINKLNRDGVKWMVVEKEESFEAESDAAKLRKYEKTYGKTGAKVRLKLLKRIKKQKIYGTKSGQWSARKSQHLTDEYEKAMKKKGAKPYKSSKRTSAQKSLKKWGDQKWRTKSGKKSSVTGERYLPSKAIDALSDKEYKRTTAAKRKAKKAGKQFSKQPKDIAKKVAKYRAEYKVGTQGPCWEGYVYKGPSPYAKGSCQKR